MRPYVVELFAGTMSGTMGFMELDIPSIGFDLEYRDYHGPCHPLGQRVIQDVLTLHGRQFKDALFIWASPPCTEYSYMAMPWSRAKQIARALRGQDEFPKGYTGSRTIEELNALFNACFRIQREASEASGRHIPMIVENVSGAQPWVGRSAWNYGSFHLWGDVPALMPFAKSVKVAGLDWSKFGTEGYKPQGFNVVVAQRVREDTGRKTTCDNSARLFKNRRLAWINDPSSAVFLRQEVKGLGLGSASWQKAEERHPNDPHNFWSRSDSRKAASAQIAKIPLPLSRHIARVYRPPEFDT